MMVPAKHKRPILELADEFKVITSLDVCRHLKISAGKARAALKNYTNFGWLKRLPKGQTILKYDDPAKQNHPISGYELTPEGKFELERMRRAMG